MLQSCGCGKLRALRTPVPVAITAFRLSPLVILRSLRHAARLAGVLRASVDWRALTASRAELPDLCNVSSSAEDADSERARYKAYCARYADVSAWPRPQGVTVTVCVNAKHDFVVPFEDGIMLWRSLQPDTNGGREDGGAAGAADCAWGQQRGIVVHAQQDANVMLRRAGGHVWGFLQAKSSLVPALQQALTARAARAL